MNSLKQLGDFGQSIWLDYIRRDLITSGECPIQNRPIPNEDPAGRSHRQRLRRSEMVADWTE